MFYVIGVGAGTLVTITAAAIAFFAIFIRLSGKGYVSLAVAGLVLTAVSVGTGIFLGVVLLTAIDGGVATILAPVVVIILPFTALALLPRRRTRRIFAVDRVSFPYAKIGQVLCVVGCLATAICAPLAWWTGGSRSVWVSILIWGPVFSWQIKQLFARYLAEPTRGAQSFADVLATDLRPPVVFMRAFERENQPFVRGFISIYGRYSEQPRVSAQQAYVHIPLDEYLRDEIMSRIGPFLALGNPQDYFTPAGATRAYFKVETWMEEFSELARRAGCLLVDAGESSNLRWELRFLRSANLHHKLVLVAGHPASPYRSPWLRLVWRVAGVPLIPWQTFARTLSQQGYEVPAGEPAYGSILGFDREARAHLLASNADFPNDFVTPIANWLNGTTLGQPCDTRPCTRCGRAVLTDAHGANVACRMCIDGAPLKRAFREIAWWLMMILAVPVFIAIVMIPQMLGLTATWIFYAWLAVVVSGIGILGWISMSREMDDDVSRIIREELSRPASAGTDGTGRVPPVEEHSVETTR